MGWEKRGNREYYYRKQRVGGRVVSEYVGAGEIAVLISRLDAMEREKQDLERWQEQQRRKEQIEVDQQLDELHELVKALTTGALVAAGYHTHKREWRRKREQTEQPAAQQQIEQGE